MKRDGNGQRFYLHEVLTQKELASRIATGAADNSGKPGGPQALYVKRLLRSAVDVNNQSAAYMQNEDNVQKKIQTIDTSRSPEESISGYKPTVPIPTVSQKDSAVQGGAE